MVFFSLSNALCFFIVEIITDGIFAFVEFPASVLSDLEELDSPDFGVEMREDHSMIDKGL